MLELVCVLELVLKSRVLTLQPDLDGLHGWFHRSDDGLSLGNRNNDCPRRGWGAL